MRSLKTRPRLNRAAWTTLAALASSALVVGCTSTGADGVNESHGESTEMTAAGIVGEQPSPSEPVNGGILSYAGYTMPSNLDPTKTQPSGETGGTEMASIYSVLVRYDSGKDEYVPHLAESLTEGADDLTWTLTLREGVTFSDGSPLDADAVVASINRYNQGHGALSEQFTDGVESVEAIDRHTVVFTLKEPWEEFPALLSLGHGMILAPASYADPNDFNPIGAGAFSVTSFSPGTSLELMPRADYWGGKPHLDTLKFVDIAGGKPKIEALQSGGIQMAFLRSPEHVNAAMNMFPGFYEPVSLGDIITINNREGRPGADERVRKAIALAVNPELVSQRAYGEESLATSKVFPRWSKWHSDGSDLTQDVDAARELLAQSKADGYDGKLTYVMVNDPTYQSIATAIQAQLNNVGFDVTIDIVPSFTALIERNYVHHDFDIAYGAYSLSDAMPTLRLISAVKSDSSNNLLGYNSSTMDTLLTTAKAATTDEAKAAALAAVEQQIYDDVPFFSWGAGVHFLPWASNVHGVVPNGRIMLLENAWVS